MVLGSDVPLTEDILKRKTEFFPDYYQWLRFNGIDKNITIAVGGVANTTMFIVPAGHVLYITSASLQGHNGGLSTGNFLFKIKILNAPVGSTILVLLTVGTPRPDDTSTISTQYSHPIKVEEGQVIEVSSFGANSSTEANVYGFLIAKSRIRSL